MSDLSNIVRILRVRPPNGAVRSIALGREGLWRIGRSGDCELSVADPAASATHAELRWGPGGAEVRDLGSRFGTFVEEQRVSEQWTPLPVGHTLWIGDTKLSCDVTSLSDDQTHALDDSLLSDVRPMMPPIEPTPAPPAPVTSRPPAAQLTGLQRTSLMVAAVTLLAVTALWVWLLTSTTHVSP